MTTSEDQAIAFGRWLFAELDREKAIMNPRRRRRQARGLGDRFRTTLVDPGYGTIVQVVCGWLAIIVDRGDGTSSMRDPGALSAALLGDSSTTADRCRRSGAPRPDSTRRDTSPAGRNFAPQLPRPTPVSAGPRGGQVVSLPEPGQQKASIAHASAGSEASVSSGQPCLTSS